MLGNLDEGDHKTPLLNAYNNDGSSVATSVDYDIVCKVILIGDSGVGKTCLFKRFSEDTFSPNHVPTTSVEFTHRFIDTLDSRCKVSQILYVGNFVLLVFLIHALLLCRFRCGTASLVGRMP